jgi:hypothetical protein
MGNDAKPEDCGPCACPNFCDGWQCDAPWCADGSVPEECAPCSKITPSRAHNSIAEVASYGPVPIVGPRAGWVVENPSSVPPIVNAGALHIIGDARLYLMEDYTASTWGTRKYARFDLRTALSLSVDLSAVPCGCIATVYLVAAADPDSR